MGNKKGGVKQQLQKDTNGYNSFKTVLSYCLLIIFLPIITFFSLKVYVFDEFLHLESLYSNIYSAIAAVIALHIALGLFIYKAYFEPDTGRVTLKKAE